MSQHLLSLGRSRTPHRKAAKMGYRTTVLLPIHQIASYDKHDQFVRIIGLPKEASIDEYIQIAKALHELGPFDAMATFTENAEEFAGEVALVLGLKFHLPTCLALTHNKYRMREHFRRTGLDDTKSALIAKSEFGSSAFRKAFESIGFPALIKPVAGRGSANVKLVPNSQAAKLVVGELNPHDYVVEEFIVGTEYSVEAFSEDGIHQIVCITNKYKSENTFLEVGHSMPAELTPSLATLVREKTIATLAAVGIVNGPSHTELIVQEGGDVRVIETHSRLGGDQIDVMIDAVFGVDLHEYWIRQFAGEKVLSELQNKISENGGAAVHFVCPAAKGTLIEWRGIEDCEKEKTVTKVVQIAEPGEQIEPAKDSFSRGLAVVAIGETAEQAFSHAHKASANIGAIVKC